MIAKDKYQELEKAVTKLVELLGVSGNLDAQLTPKMAKSLAWDYFLTSSATAEEFNQFVRLHKYIRDIRYALSVALFLHEYRYLIHPCRELMVMPKYELMVI